MKESYSEGIANHAGLEPCVSTREGRREASAEVRAGWVSSRVIFVVLGADAVSLSGRQDPRGRHRKTRRDPARSKAPRTHGTTPRENRESPRPPAADGAAGRMGKSKDAIP